MPVESKDHVRNVFFASVIDKARLNGNLVVGFQKDIRSEFPDSRDISAGVGNV
jgi:hypothetical protein